ncbi:MAG: nucleoside/nucleotide kinase family protein [Armatimonadota bacterium]
MANVITQPIILGFTGSFGSGCTYIIDNIVSNQGYKKVSLSEILKILFTEENKRKHSTRNELQSYGDSIRQNNGSGHLAEKAIESMTGDTTGVSKWVIDSIRNPAEIERFRNFTNNFYLFGIFADKDIRWDRVNKTTYNSDLRAFNYDDSIDNGTTSPLHGQRVSQCFYDADIVIANNTNFNSVGNVDFEELERRIKY